jgi:hypothetical protein
MRQKSKSFAAEVLSAPSGRVWRRRCRGAVGRGRHPHPATASAAEDGIFPKCRSASEAPVLLQVTRERGLREAATLPHASFVRSQAPRRASSSRVMARALARQLHERFRRGQLAASGAEMPRRMFHHQRVAQTLKHRDGNQR